MNASMENAAENAAAVPNHLGKTNDICGVDFYPRSQFKTNLLTVLLQASHRLGAVAMLATLGAWAMMYLMKDFHIPLAIAAGTGEAGLICALLARLLTKQGESSRRDANGVAVFNLIFFVLAIQLIVYTRLDVIRAAAGDFFYTNTQPDRIIQMNPESWMREAMAEALAAQAAGDVPIGCVIVHEPTGRIVGRGRNRRVVDFDATAHAEIVAIRKAGTALQSWRLIDCILIVTLEPCPMCAGAIVNARIPKLIYGCADPKAGAVDTLFQLCSDTRLNHRVQVHAGVLTEECAGLLTEFFREQRRLGKK